MKRCAIALLCLALTSTSCKAEPRTDCATTGDEISPASLVGTWSWTDRHTNGKNRMWLLRLDANGQQIKLVRAYPLPGSTGLDSYQVDGGTFGRWFTQGRVFSTIRDGAFMGSNPRNEKIYWVESPEPPVTSTHFIGRVSADRVELCYIGDGRHYADMRRVDDNFEIPPQFPQNP